ncbi:MAG TPA: Fe-S-containing protein, partial [Anaeromyxobacteraceae bacterium]|nr:Fe-S-containing protein [Anaeromyxobacteraceae bacterium]
AARAEGARGDALYDPLPEPVVDDGAGSVVVPLSGPFGGGDDRMRKLAYADGARTVTFFVVRRPDGTLAAALDLCEICQPKGYAQLGRGYVFCKYCRTPIPVGTVGQPGGCNPIPIPGVEVKGSLLVVPRAALVAAWERGMAGKR